MLCALSQTQVVCVTGLVGLVFICGLEWQRIANPRILLPSLPWSDDVVISDTGSWVWGQADTEGDGRVVAGAGFGMLIQSF